MAAPLLQSLILVTTLFGCLLQSLLLQTVSALREPDALKAFPINKNSLNSTVGVAIQYAYFERQYQGGWFTSGAILNTHIEASVIGDLLTKRANTHIPEYIDAYTVSLPHPYAYFNILWQPNSNKLSWRFIYDEDGTAFQASLNKYVTAGFELKQVASYAYDTTGTLYYAATFIDKKYWPADTKFDAAFGLPYNDAYCCAPGSRWTTLQQQGFKPSSVSVTQDPSTGGLFIADVWNSVYVGTWQGGIGKTWSQLSVILQSLQDQMTPVYIKAYRVSNRFNGHDINYSYLAYRSDSPPTLTLTTDISRSGWAVIANLLKKPPTAFTVYNFDGEIDWDVQGSGEMYTGLWEGVTTNN